MQYSEAEKLQFVEVLRRKNFNLSAACKAMQIPRQTVYGWRKDPWFDELLVEGLEEEIDEAEEMHRYLRKGIPRVEKGPDGIMRVTGWIKEPDRQALEFFLRTKGRGRGWSEQIEAQNRIEGRVVIVRIPDNGRTPLPASDTSELPLANE